MMMCTKEGREILKVVQEEILTGPETWTQEVYARDAHGHTASPIFGDASSFCLIGACRKAASLLQARTGEYYPTYRGEDCLRSALVKLNKGYGVVPFNDSPETTFEDVRALIAQALSPEGSASGGSQETESPKATA